MNKGAARERGEVGTWGQGSCPPPDQPPCPPCTASTPEGSSGSGCCTVGLEEVYVSKERSGCQQQFITSSPSKAGRHLHHYHRRHLRGGGGWLRSRGSPRGAGHNGLQAALQGSGTRTPPCQPCVMPVPNSPQPQEWAQQCAGTSGPSPQRDPTALGAHRNIPHQVGVAAQQLTQQEMGADEALLSPLPTGEVPWDPGGQCWHHVSLVSTPPQPPAASSSLLQSQHPGTGVQGELQLRGKAVLVPIPSWAAGP